MLRRIDLQRKRHTHALPDNVNMLFILFITVIHKMLSCGHVIAFLHLSFGNNLKLYSLSIVSNLPVVSKNNIEHSYISKYCFEVGHSSVVTTLVGIYFHKSFFIFLVEFP